MCNNGDTGEIWGDEMSNGGLVGVALLNLVRMQPAVLAVVYGWQVFTAIQSEVLTW